MKWFNIVIDKHPLYTWWKARKFFKFPDVKIKFSICRNKCHFTNSRILSFTCKDVNWKWKYRNISVEDNPKIIISLFNIFHFSMTFKKKYGMFDESYIYWETMLYYLYNNTHSLYDACVSNVWFRYLGERKVKVKPVKYALNKKGVKQYIKEKIKLGK